MYFFILVTASQRLNYISSREGWGEHSSQSALRRFTQWPWIEHITLRLNRTGHRRPNEMFVANAQVSGDVKMCSRGVAKEPTIGKQGLSYPW